MREAGGPRPLVHISYTALLGWHHKSAAVNSLTQVAAPPVVLSYLYASSLKKRFCFIALSSERISVSFWMKKAYSYRLLLKYAYSHDIGLVSASGHQEFATST